MRRETRSDVRWERVVPVIYRVCALPQKVEMRQAAMPLHRTPICYVRIRDERLECLMTIVDLLSPPVACPNTMDSPKHSPSLVVRSQR